MTGSVDWLTLVVAGAVMFHFGAEGSDPNGFELVVACVGVVLFVIGALRAFMAVVGL